VLKQKVQKTVVVLPVKDYATAGGYKLQMIFCTEQAFARTGRPGKNRSGLRLSATVCGSPEP
jgi:hypothetical protein